MGAPKGEFVVERERERDCDDAKYNMDKVRVC